MCIASRKGASSRIPHWHSPAQRGVGDDADSKLAAQGNDLSLQLERRVDLQFSQEGGYTNKRGRGDTQSYSHTDAG